MKEKIDNIINSKFGDNIRKFFNSYYYIALLAVCCIVCHTFELPMLGAVVWSILLVLFLLFCTDFIVMIPFLMMCSFVLTKDTMPQNGYYNNPAMISVLCVLLFFIVAAFVFHLIYRKRIKAIFKRTYLLVSFLLLTVVLMIGGIAVGGISFASFGTAVSIAVCMFLPYYIIVNLGEYNGEKTLKYIAWSAVAVSTVLICDVMQVYVQHDFSIDSASKGSILLGFAGPNTTSAFITITIPLVFYLVYKYKHGYALMAFIALQVLTVYSTYSRASLVVVVPGTAIVAIWLMFKKRPLRLVYCIFVGVFIAAAIAVVIYKRDELIAIVNNMQNGDFGDSGRIEIWKNGFEAWKTEPVFGVGLYYLIDTVGHWYYSFHCTPLTYLFCMGIVGLAAYVYHRYRTVRLVFSAKLNPERVFSALAILAMLCNALLDLAMTNPQHLLYYSVLLALIEMDVKKVKSVDADNKVSDNLALGND